MDQSNPHAGAAGIVNRYTAINYVATDHLTRDCQQSTRLHEPEYLITNIDPITGRDVPDYRTHPLWVDGNVTSYFESEETRQAYLDMPTDHPFRLVDNPDGEGEAEG